MHPEGKASAASKTHNGLLGLTNSLCWRQLVSSLAIITAGLAGIGTAYYHFQNQSLINEQIAVFEKDGVSLLLYVEPHPTLNFLITADSAVDELRAFLKERNFSEAGDNPTSEYYAYIQDTGPEGSIVWSTKYAFETALNGESPYKTLKRGFLTFDINVIPDHPFSGILNPIIPQGRNFNNKEREKQNSDGFLVYAKAFSYADKNYQMVLAKSAKKINESKQTLARDLPRVVILTTLLVLIAQLVGSYLVLSPIRRIENEIKLIEAGEKDLIEHTYPYELTPVKSAINTLIHAEKGQKKRYRDALDNLAHALKTPLAALQGASMRSTDGKQINQEYVDDQIQRMNDIVAYHLRRAVVSDHNAIVKLETLRPILFRLRESLRKVYFDKNFEIEINVDEYARCRVDYDDLMEVFGNLLNNACRFCESKVTVSANKDVDFLVVDIDDDGMGFPDSNPSTLLTRGMRADSKTEGQGIGLAVSTEIVENAGGKISLMMSPYVGARVRLHLPA